MYPLFLLMAVVMSPAILAQTPLPANGIKYRKALGRSGSVQAPGVYRVGLPRTDLHVRIDDVEIKPTLGLGGWLAFQKTQQGTMVMGTGRWNTEGIGFDKASSSIAGQTFRNGRHRAGSGREGRWDAPAK